MRPYGLVHCLAGERETAGRVAVLGPLIVAGLLWPFAVFAADFSYARVRSGDCATGCPYGMVTITSPFKSEREGMVPVLLLVDPGDFAKPWLRAKAVAQLLPKAVEHILRDRHALKVARDEEGHPTIFVGPSDRPVRDTDLRIVSVLARDVDRFAAETGPPSRRVDAMLVAHYWRTLLEDLVNLFIAFPLTRDRTIANRLGLVRLDEGKILVKVLVEVTVLLQLEGKALDSATAVEVKAKLGQALASLSRDQWADLVRLAFRIPSDFAAPSAAPRTP